MSVRSSSISAIPIPASPKSRQELLPPDAVSCFRRIKSILSSIRPDAVRQAESLFEQADNAGIWDGLSTSYKTWTRASRANSTQKEEGYKERASAAINAAKEAIQEAEKTRRDSALQQASKPIKIPAHWIKK